MNDGRMTERDEMNFRIKMTRTIWFFATIMLGICIPITNQTILGPFVAFAVLIAVTLTTRTIWGRDGVKNLAAVASALPTRSAPVSTPISTPSRVQELEERLANLEAITNFENKLLNKKFPGGAPTSVSPPMPVDSGAMEEARRGAARPVAS